MKKIAFALLSFALFSTPAVAQTPAFCSMMGEIAADAAILRQNGVSQEETAQRAANQFSRAINTPQAQRRMSNETRRASAKLWGFYATRIIQAAYSMPIEKTPDRKKVAVQGLSVWVYQLCLKG